MMEVVVTVGLPGAGKTTWLLEQYRHRPHVLVSADRVRLQLCSQCQLPDAACRLEGECLMRCDRVPAPRAPYALIGPWLARLAEAGFDGAVLVDTTGSTAALRNFIYSCAGVGEPGISLTLVLFTAKPANLPRRPLARGRQLNRPQINAIQRIMAPLAAAEIALADRLVIVPPRRRRKTVG